MDEKIKNLLCESLNVEDNNYSIVIDCFNIVKDNYTEKYKVKNVLGNNQDFKNIAFKAICISNPDVNKLLSEKCIRRRNDIYMYGRKCLIDGNIEQYNFVTGLYDEIFGNLIDLETFWCLEYVKRRGFELSDHEEQCLTLFTVAANCYLDHTESIYNYIMEREHSKKKSLKK